MPKIESVKIVSIRQFDDPEFGWVELAIYFQDSETEAHPSLNATVPIKFRPDWTLARIRKEACEAASTLARLYAAHHAESSD